MDDVSVTQDTCPNCRVPLTYVPSIGPACLTEGCPVLDDSAIWPDRLEVVPSGKDASITALQEKLEAAREGLRQGLDLLDNGHLVEPSARYRWCAKTRTTLKNIDGEG